MHRIVKLLWIIFILWVVSFIICDENGIKIELDGNHLVFNKIEKTVPVVDDNLEGVKPDHVALNKNSDLIHMYLWFKNPKSLHESDGIDSEYLAKLEQERLEQETLKKNKTYTWPNIISLDNNNTVSSILNSNNSNKGVQTILVEVYTWESHTIALWTAQDTEDNKLEESAWTIWNPISDSELEENKVSINKYVWNIHSIVLSKAIDEYMDSLTWSNEVVVVSDMVQIDKYNYKNHYFDLYQWTPIPEKIVSINRYLWDIHNLGLKLWKEKEYKFSMENNNIPEAQWTELSDSMIESLLMNDEIDINTLESENDEFLQKVFQETRDTDVMNLIVETYLNEYQFVKAKRFIENLPDIYVEDLKPSLNLRVVFNSFALSSKTINETLTSLINGYSAEDKLLEEDKNRYLWVIALMKKDYDNFFDIASNFTSPNHKAFVSKLQWYKNQISKQMWMPKYYFDTLVALELFNQWLFQPAKVLALSSLQQNPNYILPYQVLAYANFLTSSWDTSIEYMKKLVDLDPNNAEKYRFLMWIAYYRDGKYEQSVVMLSLIKDEKLRLDSERYLIRDYLLLDQKNKLILSWNKLLWYDNLVSSDFYTYFYEAFYHPYSEWQQYQLYAFDTELADKMIRVCSIRLPEEEKVVCSYGTIGKNIALWKFDWLEQSLLDLVSQYPQWYLYHALGEYYIHEWDNEKAKFYLLKAVSLTQKRAEVSQIKKLLQDTIQ